MARGASRRNWSASRIAPAGDPSTTTKTARADRNGPGEKCAAPRESPPRSRTHSHARRRERDARDLALQSRAHRLPDVSRGIEPKAAFVRCGDDSRGDGMLRRLLEGANDAKRLVDAPAGRGLDPQDARSANRQCAGLVEDDGARPRQRLEREPALHQDATARRARDARNIGDRSGKDQRAWRRCHEDGKPANRIAGKAPRIRESERDGQKQEREPVRHPDGRRLGGLRCRRHPHDAGVGAFAFCCRRLKRKRLTCVDSAAAHRLALAPRDGYRLAGEGQLAVSRCAMRGARSISDLSSRSAREAEFLERVALRENIAAIVVAVMYAGGTAWGRGRSVADRRSSHRERTRPRRAGESCELWSLSCDRDPPSGA